MPGKKLLVADDSLTIQKVIRLALSNEGYEIQAVPDGAEAIQQIFLSRPDIVLIDVSLPGKSGFEVKREINQHDDLEEVRFVLMSSASEKVDEAQVEEVGFHSRLTKPFDPAHLRKVLTDSLAQVAAKRMERTSMLPRSKMKDSGPPTLPGAPPKLPKAPTAQPPSLPPSTPPTSPPSKMRPPAFAPQMIPPAHPPASPSSGTPSFPPSFPNVHPPLPDVTQSEAPALPEMTDAQMEAPASPPDFSFEMPGDSNPEGSREFAPELSLSPPDDFSKAPIFEEPPTLPPDLQMDPPPTPDFPTMPDSTSTSTVPNELPSLDWSENPGGFAPPGLHLTSDEQSKSEDDSDIRSLTASTIQISGLDDYQWSVEEPSARSELTDSESSSPHLPPFSKEPTLSVTQEQLEEMVKQQVQVVLKEMSQKMLPEIAEKIIKNEIHRMLSEGI